jgi:hypothetical protein
MTEDPDQPQKDQEQFTDDMFTDPVDSGADALPGKDRGFGDYYEAPTPAVSGWPSNPQVPAEADLDTPTASELTAASVTAAGYIDLHDGATAATHSHADRCRLTATTASILDECITLAVASQYPTLVTDGPGHEALTRQSLLVKHS